MEEENREGLIQEIPNPNIEILVRNIKMQDLPLKFVFRS